MKNSKFIFVLTAALLLTGCGPSAGVSSTTGVSSASSVPTSSSSISSSSSTGVSSNSSSSTSSVSSTSASAKYQITSVSDYSEDFFTLSVKQGDEFEGGSKKTITLTAGTTLGENFAASSGHLDHIYVYVNGVCYKPVFPEGVTFSKTVDIEVAMPEKDASILACYSVQQHIKTDGHSVSFEENANVTPLGVLAREKYDYLDFHAICAETYLITKAEYRLAKDTTKTWIDIPFDSSLTAITKIAYGHYEVAIRPNGAELTDDVVVRFTGETHTEHTITYNGLDEDKYMSDSSAPPTSALNGESVSVSVFAKTGVYVKSLTPTGIPSENIVSQTLSKIEFTMPDADVSFAITFADAMTITTMTNANIATVLYYTDDPGYSESVTTAVPGNSLYVVAKAKSGYIFTGASVNGGEKVGLSDEAGLSFALLSIPNTATAINVTLYAEASHTSSIVASTNGSIAMDRIGGTYAAGETVALTVTPTSGYILDAIAITKTDGTASDVSATIDVATGNASFVMPDFDVKVSATFKVDPDAGNKVTVTLTYDMDEFFVTVTSSGENYEDKIFTVTKNTSVYLSVNDDCGNNFHVKVMTGTTTIIDADATADEETGEYTFGKSFQITGDTTITIAAA